MVWSENALSIVSEPPVAAGASRAGGDWGSIPGSPLGLGDSLLQHVSPETKGKHPYLSWLPTGNK